MLYVLYIIDYARLLLIRPQLHSQLLGMLRVHHTIFPYIYFSSTSGSSPPCCS
jgi:hypothetical protein